MSAGESDPLLAAYLAASAAEEETQLARLISQHADPLITTILRTRQTRAGNSAADSAEIDDVASSARTRLIAQLNALHEQEREAIRDFRSYVASTAYAAWAESLRARHPQRALFFNRLRYLLENRTEQKGFALWEDAEGAKWCGLASWPRKTPAPSPRAQWLLIDPAAASREALAGEDPNRLVLPDLVARILHWLDRPIELRDLTAVLAELTGSVGGAVREEETPPLIDPRHSPAEELVWKEYLRWLWQEIGTLSARQRRAFLLHSEILRECQLLGIASLRAMASALDLPLPALAEIWSRLPLDDLSIAQMLDSTRQQVINLRRVARDKLGEAWRAWKMGAGNKGIESAS